MTDQQLPDRNGDVIADIAIALTRRNDLSDEHRAFYLSIFDRFEALTSERDRLRTAWGSARRGRAEAYRQLDEARRWGRILEAQRADLRRELRAAREVTGRLPEDDMVEPSDEVPALAELADRVAALETAVDAHLGTTDEEPPARYRDRDGDLWEERPEGTLTTIAVSPDFPGDLGITLPRAVAARQYGPLTPVTTETAGGAE